jgi:hypothetical protein
VAGRKLFWLFVGVLGFIIGMQFVARFWTGPQLVAVIVGVVVGIIFALLAIFLETIAFAVAGFLAGGFVITTFANMLGLDLGGGLLYWVVYLIGAIIGVALIMVLLDWALIALSSLAGAALIVQSLSSGAAWSSILFIVLFIIGLIIQGSVLQREGHPPRRRWRRVTRS